MPNDSSYNIKTVQTNKLESLSVTSFTRLAFTNIAILDYEMEQLGLSFFFVTDTPDKYWQTYPG
jgi:hypothetical protein